MTAGNLEGDACFAHSETPFVIAATNAPKADDEARPMRSKLPAPASSTISIATTTSALAGSRETADGQKR